MFDYTEFTMDSHCWKVMETGFRTKVFVPSVLRKNVLWLSGVKKKSFFET